MIKRNNKKRNINIKDGSFNITCGTHNRNEPSVIYINGKSWIKPIHNNIPIITNELNKIKRKEIIKLINNKFFNKERVLFDVDIAVNHLSKNKKSLLSFELFLLQENKLTFDNPLITNELDILSEKIVNFIEDKIGNDVILSKKKGA